MHKQVLQEAYRLKEIFGYDQQFEFTFERGKLWITQSNDDYETVDYPQFADSATPTAVGRGHGVSGGAFRGWVANSIEKANELLKKHEKEKPPEVDGVILFLARVNPEMVNMLPKGISIVAKVLSVHAETLAQKYGMTAVYGIAAMQYQEKEKAWYLGPHKMQDGSVISIDGHENQLVYHNSGRIFLGSVPLAERRARKTSSAADQFGREIMITESL